MKVTHTCLTCDRCKAKTYSLAEMIKYRYLSDGDAEWDLCLPCWREFRTFIQGCGESVALDESDEIALAAQHDRERGYDRPLAERAAEAKDLFRGGDVTPPTS